MIRIIISVFILLASTATYGQSIKKITKLMSNKDYQKGKELAQKIMDKDPDNAAANFCMAWMSYEQNDYFSAYKHMMTFKSNENSLEQGDKEEMMAYMEEVMTRMRKKSYEERIESKYYDIEQTAINYVREKLDPEIARQFIEMFPTSPFIENTTHIKNHYAFIKAKNQNTIEALETFIKSYADAAQIETANELIHTLEFEDAKAKKSLDALATFISKYPLAKQKTEAILLRNQWAYDKAVKENSLSAIEAFIKEYPNALQLSDAKLHKQKLVFEEAKTVNTIEVYSEFVKKYPFGKYYVDIFNLKSKALGERIAQSSQIKDFQFARAFDYNQTNDNFSAAVTDPQGNMYIAGTILMDTVPLQEVWLLKLDKTGKMIWNKQFGSPANDRIDELFLQQDGSLVGIGVYGQTDTTSGQGWMLSVSKDGKKQWMKFLGNLFPISSLQDGNEIIVGGYNMDSIQQMRVIKFDKEADKKWQRTYTTKGAANSIRKHTTNGYLFCGNNWLAHISTEGYLQWDEFTDTTLTILDAIEKDGVVFAAGYDTNKNLFLYDSQNKIVTQTEQTIKQIQFLPNTDLLVLNQSNDLMQLSSAGGFIKDIAKKTDNFLMTGNFLYFTTLQSILESNIQVVKFN